MPTFAHIKSKIGNPSVFFLSFFPVLLWLLAGEFNLRFSGKMAALTSFGQISGLIGMAMFALTLVLAGRLKFIENYFSGLDKVYLTHHLLGGLSFLFLLFHPLILAAKYLFVSTQSAARFLLPSVQNTWPTNAGILALLGMILFLCLSIYPPPRWWGVSYQIRKLAHKFLGFIFFTGSLHAFFIPSDISRFAPLFYYMLALTILGSSAYLYRSLLFGLLANKFKYGVTGVNILAGNLVEIEMSPLAKKMNFSAGQFIFMSLRQKGINSELHPFTIASSPKDEKLKIIVKALGDYTSKLKELKPGAIAKIEGPYGKFFSRKQKTKNHIWVAAGIGVTPFLSMARSLDRNEHEIDFYYCAGSKEETIYLDELKEISLKNRGFRIIPFFSKDQSCRLNAEIIQKTSGDLKGKKLFICGPTPMMESLKNQFKKLNIPGFSVRAEEFQLL